MIVAAGVLCWRMLGDEPYILIIHRTQHDDFSFPKGKQDKGETIAETAVRELDEETRVKTSLGPYLGEVRYKVNSKPKIVHYWTSHLDDHQIHESARAFSPNGEVDELLWLGLTEARSLLSYDFDRELLDSFSSELPRLREAQYPIVVLRHAKAVARAEWDGDEAKRPLNAHGEQQARDLAHALSPWSPFASVVTSPWTRCVATIQPFVDSGRAGRRRADLQELLTEADYQADPLRTERFVSDTIGSPGALLICSHRPLLPAILATIGRGDSDERRAELLTRSNLAPGEFVVLQTAASDKGIHVVSVEVHAPDDSSFRV